MDFVKVSSAEDIVVQNGVEERNNSKPHFSYEEVFPPLRIDSKSKSQTYESTTTASLSNSNNSNNNNNNHNRTGVRTQAPDTTHVYTIPASERRSDNSDKFGEDGAISTCKQISRDTGVSIEITTSKDRSLTFLFTGKPNDVIEAKKRVIVSFKTQATQTINIPKEHHRWILGKSGQRMKDLEKETGCRITIPAIHEQSDKIIVVGPREGIEKAMHQMKLISDEQLKKAQERFVIPKLYYPFITGVNNEKIDRLISETGTKINVPPISSENNEIVITGERDSVIAAKNHLLNVYHEMEKTCQTISIQVPKWQHKYVIGNKKATINSILQDTGVSVEVPPIDVPGDTITLRGPCKTLGDALTILREKATNMQCFELDAPKMIHKYVIGKNGRNVCDLKCHIEFNDNDKIRVEALPEFIEDIKTKLAGLVDYFSNFEIVEVEVNPRHFKHIIGKGGANINRLKNEYDVSISINDKGEKIKTEKISDIIKLEGMRDNVAKVKQILLDQIERLENEKEREIIIHHRHHRTFMSSKRDKLKELQDNFRVIILFPVAGDHSNIVKIRGQKKDIDSCYKDLSKIVKEMDELSYCEEVQIFKQLHRCIIGKSGKTIKSIRDETGAKIDLPDENDTSDTIVITGRKANVLEAKERLLKIQDEMAEVVSEEVTVSSKCLARKKLIQGIRDDCGGVMIKLPNDDTKSDKIKIVVRGPAEDVAKAKKQLADLEKQCFSAEIKAKPEHHKFLIGKNGVKISKIRDETKALIVFPHVNDTDRETIVIMGKETAVKQAKAELEKLILQVNSTVEKYIDVDMKYHRNFTVNRAELVNKITNDCGGGVIISFPRSSIQNPDTKVVVKGNENEVDYAIQAITNYVKDLERHITADVIIPFEHHRTICVSKLPPTLSDIRKSLNVEINFPDRNSPNEPFVNGNSNGEIISTRDIVKIKGTPENVEKAKQALLDMLPITVELEIPYTYHSGIIGQKGNVIRGIVTKYDVNIDVPDQKEMINIIKIRGRPSSVEEAKRKILEKKDEMDAEREEYERRNYEIDVDVDPKFHQYIIGPKGYTINKIREERQVQIQLPKKDDPKTVITIVGVQEDAEKARDDIMEIVCKMGNRYSEDITISNEIHSRLIGAKGRNVKKLMQKYKVEIRFPRSNDPDPDIVTVSGDRDNVEDCIEELYSLENTYMDDVKQRAPSKSINLQSREEPIQNGNVNNVNSPAADGFVVKNAPWDKDSSSPEVIGPAPDMSSNAEFPIFGRPVKARKSSGISQPNAVAVSISTIEATSESVDNSAKGWGPRRS